MFFEGLTGAVAENAIDQNAREIPGILYLINGLTATKRRFDMADLEQLKQKYSGVISTIEGFSDLGATVEQVDLDGEKLHLKATVPSTVVANCVWNAIKEADATYADLHHEMTTSGGAEQPYTIQSGDNLSKIAKRFYGNANKYTDVAQANGLDDPDKIQVGQNLSLPVLS